MLLVLLTAITTTPCTGSVPVERVAFAMGTELRVTVRGADRACGLAATEAALRAVERVDDLLSSWRTTSELGVLNAAPAGVAVTLSAELLGLLQEVDSHVRASARAFDPAIGSLIDAWDLRAFGRLATDAEIATALAHSGWDRLRYDAGQRVAVRPSNGWWLDSGAFGKGAALRAAAGALRAAGVEIAELDFGGQQLFLGAATTVGVAHPSRRHEPVGTIAVPAGFSVSTTSASERFVTASGQRLGHVLDPRTGRPVPAWGSVTAIAADALAADAMSTALFVMGPDAALEWAARHPEFRVLVLIDDVTRVRARTSANLHFNPRGDR